MSTSGKDALQEARNHITKFRQEWDAANAKFQKEEEQYYNSNKDGNLKDWVYTKDANNAWGGTWSKKPELVKKSGTDNKPIETQETTVTTSTTAPTVVKTTLTIQIIMEIVIHIMTIK